MRSPSDHESCLILCSRSYLPGSEGQYSFPQADYLLQVFKQYATAYSLDLDYTQDENDIARQCADSIFNKSMGRTVILPENQLWYKMNKLSIKASPVGINLYPSTETGIKGVNITFISNSIKSSSLTAVTSLIIV